jgi:hypothetical protein
VFLVTRCPSQKEIGKRVSLRLGLDRSPTSAFEIRVFSDDCIGIISIFVRERDMGYQTGVFAFDQNKGVLKLHTYFSSSCASYDQLIARITDLLFVQRYNDAIKIESDRVRSEAKVLFHPPTYPVSQDLQSAVLKAREHLKQQLVNSTWYPIACLKCMND